MLQRFGDYNENLPRPASAVKVDEEDDSKISFKYIKFHFK